MEYRGVGRRRIIKHSNKKTMNRFISILTAACMAITACSRVDDIPAAPQEDAGLLQISVSAEEPTKAMFHGSTLPNGSIIGVALFGPDGATYSGKSYRHVGYLAEEYPGGQIWNRTPGIYLTEEVGTLYAYYPCSNSSPDITSIYFQVNGYYQDDIMYATPVTGLDINNTHARLKMHHALAAVRVFTSRGTYEGPGSIRSLGVGGQCGGTAGRLDATTGRFNNISKGSTIFPTQPFTLSDEPNVQDILLIPTGEPGELIVKMTVDDVAYTLSGVEILLEQGKITNLYLKVDKGKLSLSSVKVSSWYQYNKGSYSAPADFNVLFDGNTEGLSFCTDIADNGDVTVVAVPYMSKDAKVNPATVTGKATVTQTVDETTGNLTISICDMKSDCTVTFNGVSS